MQTPAKLRKEAERERMTAKGFRRLDAWVHSDDMERVRGFIDRLNEERLKARVVVVRKKTTSKA